jgi:hypothetical protein
MRSAAVYVVGDRKFLVFRNNEVAEYVDEPNRTMRIWWQGSISTVDRLGTVSALALLPQKRSDADLELRPLKISKP